MLSALSPRHFHVPLFCNQPIWTVRTMTSIKVKDDGGVTLTMIDVGGGNILPNFFTGPTRVKQIFDDMPYFSMRDDDLMLCSFAKTGTNWLFEIISMMTSKSAESVKGSKMYTMMEATSPEDMERLPSPRVMNCHLKPRYLPEDLKKKQIKTVLILRNPKDTAVSYYNHMKAIKIYEYNGEWKHWLPPYLRGEYEYGRYTDYLREWQEVIDQETAFPLHVMYFEDLKMDGITEIEKLEKFLDLDLGTDLREAIIDACHFERMKKEKVHPEITDSLFHKGFGFLRKGQVGDWKNWFTVQQNELFDQFWKDEAEGLRFPFTY